ncbi:MAG: DUF4340 domain-containing protein [Candidatus Aminicenantes bacterium]|nr:DUF4340 domain-containing protein [Candidatus Aminicenantes bacterium]
MKFKTTIILCIVFAALLAFIFLSDIREKGKPAEPDKLVDLSSDDVEKIILKTLEESITFSKDKEGDWLITEPLEAKADKHEVDRIADDFSSLNIERVVEEEGAEPDKYGIPQNEVSLIYKGKEEPVKVLIGMENPLDKMFFAKRADETRIVLIPAHLKSILEKKVFDFREKKIFQFKTDEVKSIDLKSGDIQWQAEKKGDDWFLMKPLEFLAEKSKITSILSALSDLKANGFVSEAKKEEEIKEYALDRPEREVTLGLPLENQTVTFTINKIEDKTYATTSLSSKIVEVEDSILETLAKEPGEMRDKDVAAFYSWEAKKIRIRKGETAIEALKDKENNWHLDKDDGEEADKEKIESLIRKIENLEAEEFVDPPLKLTDYGLDSPQVEITISVKEGEDKTKDITLWVGKTVKEIVKKADGEQETATAEAIESEEEKTENKVEEEKWVFVKNARFDYLFKTKAEFLEEIPENSEVWKKPAEEEKEDKN